MAGIKTFAQEARRNLMQGVLQRIEKWGFDEQGQVLEEVEKVSGGYVFRGQVHDDQSVFAKWQALKSAIAKKGIEAVVEEGAYTWFNRMMAIRILSKNGYIPKQLEYVSTEAKTPQVLANARRGQYSFLNSDEQTRLASMLTDYEKDNEAFSILLTGYCRSHNTLNWVFGKLDDYTELLLPDNMLQESGFLHILNTTDAISHEEYQKVELIGWLYQFYISERKGEVFASFKKNKKAEAKDIPAATQIFTPNWIVKYMVENTAGKIWLEKYPDSPLKENMKYLVENNSSPSQGEEPRELGVEGLISEVEDLTLMDPACGSGHILVEGFDLIYQMYMEEFVPPEEAVKSIFEKNLFGLDIDDRAAQLATFAILLKAAKVYPDIWTKDWLPQVYAMPEAKDFSRQEVLDFLGTEGQAYADQLYDALLLMKQAKNLGSVMKLELSNKSIDFITARFEALLSSDHLDLNQQLVLAKLKDFMPVMLLLCKKYASVVANPPYMASKRMNKILREYCEKGYPLSKHDLFAIFQDRLRLMLSRNGLLGMINQHVWMFGAKYEKFRNDILLNNSLCSMLHLGPRVFKELSGEVVQSTAFILNENFNKSIICTYHQLNNYDDADLKKLAFLNKENKVFHLRQEEFFKISGAPVSYWATSKTRQLYSESKRVEDFSRPRQGMKTSDNDRFLRFWNEISYEKIGFDFESDNSSKDSGKKWFPYDKGGGYRKWFGNNNYLINWENGGSEVFELATKLYKTPTRTITGIDGYFKEGLTWSSLSGGDFSLRYTPKGFLYDAKGSKLFLLQNVKHDLIFVLLGYMNTKLVNYFLSLTSPTLDYNVGPIKTLPFINNKAEVLSKDFVAVNIDLSKSDWDSRETSWDFEQSPLLNETASIEQAYQSWQKEVSRDFFRLHANEEELNRIFIEIYGLQDELTPEVALKDITILQEELDRKELERLEPVFREQGKEAIDLPINKAEVIQQFISYALGLMLGRYRLDKPGLNMAHPDATEEEKSNYTYNGRTVIIDEDAIVPLMGKAATFTDDAYFQVQELLHTIWGADTLIDNINFIEECLDKDLEKYLVKDFWKDHCQRYKKKPIYWLFSSPKGAFQVLVYMHRMNRFTLEKIRSEYLLPHMKHLRNQIEQLEASGTNPKLEEKLSLQLIECQEYDLLLKDKADQQIEFDLDDGVTENIKLFEGVVAKVK